MWFLVYIFVFSILFYIVSEHGHKWTKQGRALSQRSAAQLPEPIPPGYQIYCKDPSLAGSNYRRVDKLRFAESSGQTLRLEREPDNPKDPNAIQVIGDCIDDDYVIGYLPKQIAKQITNAGLFDVIKPRLCRIYIGERGDGYVEIQYQIVGPKSSKQQFDAAAL